MSGMNEKKTRILYAPAHGKRLGRFAASHFVISGVGAILAIPTFFLLGTVNREVLSWIVLVLGELIALLAYVFFGGQAAKESGWTGPKNVWDGFLAFLFPALIAWAWGSLMLCFLALPGRFGWEIIGLFLPINFLGAFPSFLIVFSTLVLGFLDGGLPNMILCMLLAGGLPPLLFLLGSIWGSRKVEQRAMRAEKEQEGNDGT